MTDWAAYVAEFHALHPGISEQVLTRTTNGDTTPYTWLARAVSGQRVLDLACGNGALTQALREEGRASDAWVVGSDLSVAELRDGRRRGRTEPVVVADALRLPFADACFDAVVCSAGLMVVSDVDAALVESGRVLRAGGVFAATVATVRPVRPSDVRLLAPLTARLRSTPQFPAGGELTGLGSSLAAAGFTVLEDASERFGYVVRTAEDADLLMRALYLPGTPDRRRVNAARWLAERASSAPEDGVDVAVPVRRLVALRS